MLFHRYVDCLTCERELLFLVLKVFHTIVSIVKQAVVAIRSMKRKAKDGAAALIGMASFVSLVLLSALWVLWSLYDVL